MSKELFKVTGQRSSTVMSKEHFMFKVKYCDLSLMCHIFALTPQTLVEQVLTGLVREPCLLNEFGFGFQCFRVLLQVAALRDHFIQERPFDAGRAGVTRPSDFLSASSE